MSELCRVTGVLKRVTNASGGAVTTAPAPGATLTVCKVVKEGAAFTTAPASATSDADGNVILDLPRGSKVFLFGQVVGFDAQPRGTCTQVPDAEAANLDELIPASPSPTPAATQAALQSHAAVIAGEDTLGHVRVGAGLAIDEDGVLSVEGVTGSFATEEALADEVVAREAGDAASLAAAKQHVAISTQNLSADGTVIDTGRARIVVFIDTSDADVTVTLPPAAQLAGRSIVIKKLADANTVIIDGDGAELIDDALVVNLEARRGLIEVTPVGSGWQVIGR